MSESARRSKGTKRPVPKSLLATLVSLVVGLGVGTTFGRSVLDSAGVPASCVRTIQRADRALVTGRAVADNGKAALDAVKGLRIGEAGDLLSQARRDASRLFDQAKQFDRSRSRCNADRR